MQGYEAVAAIVCPLASPLRGTSTKLLVPSRSSACIASVLHAAEAGCHHTHTHTTTRATHACISIRDALLDSLVLAQNLLARGRGCHPCSRLQTQKLQLARAWARPGHQSTNHCASSQSPSAIFSARVCVRRMNVPPLSSCHFQGICDDVGSSLKLHSEWPTLRNIEPEPVHDFLTRVSDRPLVPERSNSQNPKWYQPQSYVSDAQAPPTLRGRRRGRQEHPKAQNSV